MNYEFLNKETRAINNSSKIDIYSNRIIFYFFAFCDFIILSF